MDNPKEEILWGEAWMAQFPCTDNPKEPVRRPVVVIQNNKGNYYGNTVIVVILTSHIKKENMPTHVVIESGICAGLMAQAEQIHTLQKWRLYQYIGTIDPIVMDQIEWAVCVSLGLELPKRERRCLCARCLREYQDKAKYKIRRVYRYQTSMDTCDRCRLHPGFDCWVLSNDQEIHKNRQIQQNPEARENVNEKK